MDAETSITFDEALEIPLVDEGAGNLVPVPVESDALDSDTLDDGHIDSPALTVDNDLSLDQAAALWSDPEQSQLGPYRVHEMQVSVDGHAVSVGDLIQGFTNWNFYNTQLMGWFGAVQEVARNVQNNAWNLAGVISNLAPVPSPALANADWDEYVRQKAAHEQCKEVVMSVLQIAEDAKRQADELKSSQHATKLANENARFVEHFPEVATPDGRAAFFDSLRDVAYACDFTERELMAASDHRFLRLARYAAIGLNTERSRAEPGPRRRRRKQQRRAATSAVERFMDNPTVENAVEAYDF